jgi:hypothetical protein
VTHPEFPHVTEDFVNPITNPELPHIVEPDFTDPVPVERLANEPVQVTVEEAQD